MLAPLRAVFPPGTPELSRNQAPQRAEAGRLGEVGVWSGLQTALAVAGRRVAQACRPEAPQHLEPIDARQAMRSKLGNARSDVPAVLEHQTAHYRVLATWPRGSMSLRTYRTAAGTMVRGAGFPALLSRTLRL
jgi:hypothetical protein